MKTDSTATIKFTGLMGQNFVAIDFGSPGATACQGRQPAQHRRAARPERHDAQARQRGHRRRKPDQELHRRSRLTTCSGRSPISSKHNNGPLTATIRATSTSSLQPDCRRAKAPWANSSKTRRSTIPPSPRSATCRAPPPRSSNRRRRAQDRGPGQRRPGHRRQTAQG